MPLTDCSPLFVQVYQTFLAVFLLPVISGTRRVLLWDNHSTHINDAVDTLIRAEHHIYVARPPNSPDFSFIEPCFHLIKQELKVGQSGLMNAH